MRCSPWDKASEVNYYNEFDPFAAAWLQQLIDHGLIPPGYIDTRSIKDVQPEDVRGFTQCHFFAGIGGWSYALALAGWPEDRPIWTGSCPCQPFSTAGKRQGVDDERHLWPEFARLIGECNPPVVIGEQVASKDGRLWLAGVRADLEGMGYAVGAADLCAAGVASPHLRQRLYWVADSAGTRCYDTGTEQRINGNREDKNPQREFCECQPTHRSNEADWVADSADLRRQQRRETPAATVQGERAERGGEYTGPGETGQLEGGSQGLRGDDNGMANPISERGRSRNAQGQHATHAFPPGTNHWDDTGIIESGDGARRRAPLEPSLFPLAHGIPNRVGLLRGAGNAIVPPLAAKFIRAYEEARA